MSGYPATALPPGSRCDSWHFTSSFNLFSAFWQSCCCMWGCFSSVVTHKHLHIYQYCSIVDHGGWQTSHHFSECLHFQHCFMFYLEATAAGGCCRCADTDQNLISPCLCFLSNITLPVKEALTCSASQTANCSETSLLCWSSDRSFQMVSQGENGQSLCECLNESYRQTGQWLHTLLFNCSVNHACM